VFAIHLLSYCDRLALMLCITGQHCIQPAAGPGKLLNLPNVQH